MTSNSNSDSIMQQISHTEEAIKMTYDRIFALQLKSRGEGLSETKQKEIERELEEVQKLLKTHEQQLAHLRTHNRQSFLFVVGLVSIIFAIYALYILIFGPNF